MNATPRPGKEPTPRELEILKILWERGASNVKSVHQQLAAREPDLAYNTVQTMLRLMDGKGLVEHVLDGRTFVYSACFSRAQTTKQFLEGVLERVFDGAVSQLVLSLLQSEKVSTEELEQMQTLIAEARQRNGREGGKR